ncbi:MAG: HIT family protein [Acidimicrobiia bacterium]
MTDCVFCDLVAGAARASVAYEDGATLAVLDPRQPRVGHMLVIPKKHVENVFDLDTETGAAIMHTTTVVARAVRRAFAPDGVSLWQSNGTGAGQEVPHFHMHVMPRWYGDALLRIYPDRLAPVDRAELDHQAAKIREAIEAR